jgi:hypothetical protein
MPSLRVPLILTAAGLLAAPTAVQAQSLAELVGAGRFEEAAASLAAAGPEEADAGAELIFNEAYSNGFQQRDFAYATRGFVAAKQVPGLSERRSGMLDFWDGFAHFQSALPLAQLQNLEAARASLPLFQEARVLIEASGEYPASVNMDVGTILIAITQFIEIQEAIIQRGY